MPKKLKIGLVLDDTLDTPDGVQQYVLTLGGWLASKGHTVHYLVGKTKRNDIPNIHSLANNVKVSFNQNKMSIPYNANTKNIKKTLDNLNLDVLHIQMPYNPLFAGKVINAIDSKVAVIGTFHIAPASWLVSAGGRALRLSYYKSIKRFDEIIAVSQAAKDFASKNFKINSVVIPNVVDINKYLRKPVSNKTVHIVYLGRLVQRKGCVWLLRALNELKNMQGINYSVTIASSGPLMAKLKKYVVKNGLSNVEFIGYVDEKDKPGLLSSADIAVFPSTGGESFGIVLIEAMAAGSRVVLGGDNEGYRTVLGDYPNQLVNPKDTKLFSELLYRYINNPQDRINAFNWNQKNVKKYDINIVGQDIEKIYYKHKQLT
ncbi:MAG: glycosyltransferase family 4 protein [Patescibacteria group bacterium]|jgi:phosphatidylinositol alpha-mannosyltransferase|nr:glycosyltransferase family 4 protein [Patescibacteria group bacterium]